MEEYTKIKKQELINLLDLLEQQKKERKILKEAVINICKNLGFYDEKENRFKSELFEGKSKSSLIFLVGSKLPNFISAFHDEESQIKQSFTNILPILTKYANE